MPRPAGAGSTSRSGRPRPWSHPLLDADTRAAATRQLFAARRTPELARAAQDAASVVGSAERLVAASPYRRAATRTAAPSTAPGGLAGPNWPARHPI